MRKKLYIHNVYASYIMDMIVQGLYYNCNRSKKGGFAKENSLISNRRDKIEWIQTIGTRQSTIDEFGEPVDFDLELNTIVVLLERLKIIYKEDELKYLQILGRYVCSRLHNSEENNGFRYIEAFEELIDVILKIPEKCFFKEYILFNIVKETDKSLEELLKVYDKYNTLEEADIHSNITSRFKISFESLSEGEERFVDNIAKINDCICENDDTSLLVLLFDEPDQALHPELSRRFIDIITKAVNSLEYEGKIQIIISTHSPYLISDILPGGVITLNRNNDNKDLEVSNLSKQGSSYSLGANIYDLLNQKFFMNNTVGEFATQKIKLYSEKINNLEQYMEEIKEIESFVELIGEPIIKTGLKRQLENKKYELEVKKNKEQILKLITNEHDKEKVNAFLKKLEK